MERRSFDKTSIGIDGISSSPDATVGVTKKLTLEPNIVGARGYIKVEDDLSKLKDVNLFTPAELLTPLGVTRDDSIRTAMASKQSGHIIPVKNSCPVLISNGIERTIPYHMSNDFTIIAEEDGVVEDINEKLNLIIISYKNGDCKIIETNPKIAKNSASGFYLSNKLVCDLKKGQKFQKNDILAYNDKFFVNSKGGVKFNIGSLEKVACMSTYATFEDSTFVTDKLSDDLTSEIIMHKNVALGKNANVDYIVKIGDKVEVGSPLVQFEQSKSEDSINKLLSSIGEDLKEDIVRMGKQAVKSKYSGVIEDIKIYCTVEPEELSPSLRKIVEAYYKDINARKNYVKKYRKDEFDGTDYLFTESASKVETKDGKVKGMVVNEGVLIEFYIKYIDRVGVGDKIVMFAALKSIVGEKVPKGLEPYTVDRPDEEISTIFAPAAVDFAA